MRDATGRAGSGACPGPGVRLRASLRGGACSRLACSPGWGHHASPYDQLKPPGRRTCACADATHLRVRMEHGIAEGACPPQLLVGRARGQPSLCGRTRVQQPDMHAAPSQQRHSRAGLQACTPIHTRQHARQAGRTVLEAPQLVFCAGQLRIAVTGFRTSLRASRQGGRRGRGCGRTRGTCLVKRNTGLVTVKKCFVRPAHVDWSYCGASRVKGFSAIGATRGRPAKDGELPDFATARVNRRFQLAIAGGSRRHRRPLRSSRIHPLCGALYS